MEALEFATSKPSLEGPDKLATILLEEAKSCWRWIAMNAERCRDANLPFEPSMRRADGALAIAIIEYASINRTARTKRKWPCFEGGTFPNRREVYSSREKGLSLRTSSIHGR